MKLCAEPSKRRVYYFIFLYDNAVLIIRRGVMGQSLSDIVLHVVFSTKDRPYVDSSKY